MDRYLNKILQGNALEVLAELPGGSVQCCVTSPPYYGLRDYGVEPSVWGGKPDCNHDWIGRRYYTEKSAGKSGAEAFSEPGAENIKRLKEARWRNDSICSRCGAWLGCLGLEPTLEMYVEHIVMICREVRRTLRKDGVFWLNLGDSYAVNRGYQVPDSKHREVGNSKGMKAKEIGLKPKDLLGVPWRVAFALQADGWWLRQDIVWSKTNPMPESVRDRCTRSHEYIFIFTKSKKYFYDHVAVMEPAVGGGVVKPGEVPGSYKGSPFNKGKTAVHQLNRSSNSPRVHANLPGRSDGGSACNKPGQEMRHLRSVWTVSTKPVSEAHFAVYPEELIRPCVLAGTRKKDIVLDPFMGSGTTAVVAEKLGRNWIGIEKKKEYIEIAEKRLAKYREQMKLL